MSCPYCGDSADPRKHRGNLYTDFLFFKCSEEKAYMLGFIFADGYNNERWHKLEIRLAKQDKDILIKFSKILLNENNVKEYDDIVGLYVVSQDISSDLKKLGCPAKKTFILKFPDLPENLCHHFIRGYFDGDGMLAIYQPNMKKNKYAEFSICSTKEMLDEIGLYIADLGVNFKINKRHKMRNNNNFTLRVGGSQQIKKVCDFLYKNAHIYLNRKYEKYMELIKMSKSFRRPYKIKVTP